MKTTNLGPPVIAYTGIGYCNAKHQHEIVFLTDGFVAYAYGSQRDAFVSRAGATYTVHCREVTGLEDRGTDEVCDGEFTFNLADAGGWLSVPEQLALLVCYGVPVDE